MILPRLDILLFGFTMLIVKPTIGSPQTITVATRDQIVKAVEQAKPGTTISIASGTHQGGLHFNGLQGQEGMPIILAAAENAEPPIFQGNNSCFHLTDPAFVELHNLILTDASGNGINIDNGGSYDTPAHHVVLLGLTIRDVGPEGNHDAIKLSGLDNFRVENCKTERWRTSGSGIDLVGCHRGEVVGYTFRYRSDVAAMPRYVAHVWTNRITSICFAARTVRCTPESALFWCNGSTLTRTARTPSTHAVGCR